MSHFDHINVNGATLFAAQHSTNAKAPWLVFVNSLMTDHHVWDAQLAAFGDTHRILRYDQRGHGLSSDPTGALSFDILGNDLLAVMDYLEIECATIVGLSMGVPTALDVASKQPDRLSRLVLTDGQARTTPQGAALWETRIQLANAEGMAPIVADSLARGFAPGFSQAEPELYNSMCRMMQETRLAGYVGAVQALQAFDYSAVLAQLNCPVLLLAGARDGGLPGVMQAMAGEIREATFRTIADAGHIPNVEQHRVYNAELAAFMAQNPI